MKNKIIGLLLTLLAMISVPLLVTDSTVFKEVQQTFSAEKTEGSGKELHITEALAGNFRKKYGNETLKALAIILNTNYKSNPNSFLSKEKRLSRNAFLKKYPKNGEKYYALITNAVKSTRGKYITYKGKAVYIPYFHLSRGYTLASRKYPYIKTTASPWDCLEKSFKNNQNTTGVSINGINALCQRGLSCTEALNSYLNGAKTTAART